MSEALLRRTTVGLIAGTFAGTVDFYIGFISADGTAVLGHYKLLSLSLYVSITPYILAGTAFGVLFHLFKSLTRLKERTFFDSPPATVVSLAVVSAVAFRLLWFTGAYRAIHGSPAALAYIIMVTVLFAPACFSLAKSFTLISRVAGLRALTRWAVIPVLATALSVPAAVSLYSAIGDFSRAPGQPFICLVLIDALRADHCSCYGYERETTPRIDSIAENGVIFESCYAQAPWTKPSMATVFTGLPPSGHSTNRVFDALPPAAVTFQEVLAANGYTTVAYSANYHISERFGFARGFDFFVTEETPVAVVGGSVGAGLLEALFTKAVRTDEREQALEMVRRASFLLRYLNKGPVFLYIHIMEPHEPYIPAERFAGAFGPPTAPVRFRPDRVHMEVEFVEDPETTLDLTEAEVKELIRRYDCEVLQSDFAFGELVEALEKQGRLKNLLLIITADHGEEFMEHGFLYHARALYKESLHVPLIIVDSKTGGPPRRIDEPAALADLAPTIYDWAGVPPNDDVACDLYGISLVPALSGRELPPDREILSEIDRDVFSSKSHDPSETGPSVGYIKAEALTVPGYKLIHDYNRDRVLLFDLKADPYEREPLRESTPGAARLEKTLDDLLNYYKERRLEAVGSAVDEESWRKMRDLGYIR